MIYPYGTNRGGNTSMMEKVDQWQQTKPTNKRYHMSHHDNPNIISSTQSIMNEKPPLSPYSSPIVSSYTPHPPLSQVSYTIFISVSISISILVFILISLLVYISILIPIHVTT